MKILVTGATGFVGSHVVPRMLEAEWEVRCYARPGSNTRFLPCDRIQLRHGELDNPPALEEALDGIGALVHLAPLGYASVQTILEVARAAGLQRSLFMSSTQIFATFSRKDAWLASEGAILNSGLHPTILRPTMIYGSARDGNMSRLIHHLSRRPFILIPGTGRCLLQPVHVGDVAEAVVRALASAKARDKTYNVPGATALSFIELVDIVCGLTKRRVSKICLPLGPIAGILSMLERLPFIRLPVGAEQVRRFQEDKCFDYAEAARDFGYQPRSFIEGIRQEIRGLGFA